MKIALTLKLFLLLSLTSNALLAGPPVFRDESQWIFWEDEVYQGEPFRFEQTPYIAVFGTPPFEAEWYIGIHPDEYSIDTDFSQYGELISESTNFSGEGEGEEETYFSEIPGPYDFYQNSIEGIFAVVRNTEGIDVFQYSMTPPVRTDEPDYEPWPNNPFEAVRGTKPYYYRGSILGGPGTEDPHVNLAMRGPQRLTVEFYSGELGDTTQLLASKEYVDPYPSDDPTYFQERTPPIVMDGFDSIWIRIWDGPKAWDNFLFEFELIEAEPLKLRSWYDGINHFHIGSDLEFEFDLEESGTVEKRLYWGKSGDRSNPIISKRPGFPGQYAWPVVIEVPSEPREFWGEAWNEVSSIEMPTAILTPLKKIVPEILSQPTEVFFFRPEVVDNPSAYAAQFKLKATGGGLTFKNATPSNQANLLLAPFTSNDKSQHIILTNPAYGEEYIFEISNEMGSVLTEPILISKFEPKQYDIAKIPYLVPLLEDIDYGTYNDREHTPLWLELHDGYPDRVELIGEGINKELNFTSQGIIYNQTNSLVTFPVEENGLKDLPHGFYQFKVTFEQGPARYSGFFEMGSASAVLRNAPENRFASTLRFANSITNGGANTASVMIKGTPKRNASKIRTRIGARYAYYPFTSTIEKDNFSHPLFTKIDLTWLANSPDNVWFLTTLKTGEKVKIQIKSSTKNFTYEGQTQIELPLGAEFIPVPVLEDESESWKSNAEDDAASKTTIPIDLNKILGQLTKLTPTLTAPTGTPPVFTISVNPDLPPQVINRRVRMPVINSGYVLFNAETNGYLNRTTAYESQGDDNWEKVLTSENEITGTIKVSDNATKIKFIFTGAGGETELIADLLRIPEHMLTALGIMDYFLDTAYSPFFGSFHNISYYPWIQHDEWGWVYPLTDGEIIYFYGDLLDDGFSWYATSRSLYPYLKEIILDEVVEEGEKEEEEDAWIYYEENADKTHFDFRADQWNLP